MKLRQLLVFLLILALAGGCSEEAPKPEKTPASTAPPQISTPVQAPKRQENVASSEVKEEAAPAESVERKKMADEYLQTTAGAQKVKYASEEAMPSIMPPSPPPPPQDGETYNKAKETGFLSPLAKPLSTFSIDVDTASYSNVRRFISEGQRPPAGAVRIEELINYFSYSYPQPNGAHPFSVTTELGPCPWNSSHKLARIGLKAKDIDTKDLPPSNLVFLTDVSGSMSDANKLPLLKQALRLLVRQLGGRDRVAMVVYAGSDAVVLEPTPGSEQGKILAAIDSLGAGGSTHASSGIVTAYQLAEQSFISGGNNRVILPRTATSTSA